MNLRNSIPFVQNSDETSESKYIKEKESVGTTDSSKILLICLNTLSSVQKGVAINKLEFRLTCCRYHDTKEEESLLLPLNLMNLRNSIPFVQNSDETNESEFLKYLLWYHNMKEKESKFTTE